MQLASGDVLECGALVVATGGKSIPKMGATDLGYRLAQQFAVPVTDTRPGLVPLTFEGELLERLEPLAGVAAPARVRCGKTSFDEALLFTHRGLSGPAILQISSYWREGKEIAVNLLPGGNAMETLRAPRGNRTANNRLPERAGRPVVAPVGEERDHGGPDYDGALGGLSDARLKGLWQRCFNDWRIIVPPAPKAIAPAEVTLGGIDTQALGLKTMQARAVPGLYFIGELVDVTGWLGGYNFQWAWSSGWCAGISL